MRLTRRSVALAAAALLATPALASAAVPAGLVGGAGDTLAAPVLQPWLERRLATAEPTEALRVAVRGTSVDAAATAVEAAGLRVQQRWPLVDAVVAVGPAAAVGALSAQDGVLRVDGDVPLDFSLETAHQATRSTDAAATVRTAAGAPVDGTGVTVAVIYSGIDATHPFFRQAGATKVVQNRKNACGIDLEVDPRVSEACFVSAADTDTVSAGGHGTHVAGIVAGVPVTTTAGEELRGAAAGAKLVGLSVGAGLGLVDAMAAQNWVLEHQQNPCRPAAQQTTSTVDPACPPIRVTNHSYGPAASSGEDNEFDEGSLAVELQRALVKKGVVAVWAAGNDGGDGKNAFTNPDAMDPTPGILMVASYDDAGTGDRDNALSDFSSRGKKGAPSTYPDLSAPGDRITSSCRAYLPVCSTGLEPSNAGDYNAISGTSMAAPYVAGVVAQLFQANPALTPAQVEDVLEDTAHSFAFGGAYESDPRNANSLTSFDKGHGLVDVLAALSAVPSGSTGTTTDPGPTPTCKAKGKRTCS